MLLYFINLFPKPVLIKKTCLLKQTKVVAHFYLKKESYINSKEKAFFVFFVLKKRENILKGKAMHEFE